jgi:uncharacterized protein (TIGR03663 family)
MIFVLLLLLCLMRFQELGLKAVHHDESINAWFTGQIWSQGWYNYDPTNYHGPLAFYLFQFGELVNGWGIETLRGVTVLFSCFWLFYLWRFWRRYQWPSSWFLLVVAMSPGFLFFARSAIHEMPFLFFLTIALGGLIEVIHYQQGRGWKSLIWGLAGAILLKETWVILVLALVVSALITGGLQRDSWLRRWLQNPQREISEFKLRARGSLPEDTLLHLFFALLLIVLMYTGFGRKPQGLWDLVITYLPWFKTGVHSGGHDKPVWYWLKLLWLYEKPLLLLFVGLGSTCVFFYKQLSPVGKWLGLASVLNVLIYSVIPYKTPWCFLAVWGPMVLIYGLLKSETQMVRFGNPAQAWLGIGAFICLGFQWEQNRQLNFVNPTHPNHEYVYVQTDQRLKTLVDQLYTAAAKNPTLYNEPVLLAGAEPWPLAWWLGRFRKQNLTTFKKLEIAPALFVMVDPPDFTAAMKAYPAELYEIMKFPIREGREASMFFVRKDLVANLQKPTSENLPSEDTDSQTPVIEGER